MRRGWGRGGRRNHHRCVYFKEKHRLLFRHLEPCSDGGGRINRQRLQEPEMADASSREGIRSQIPLPVYNKNCRAELPHCPNMAVPSASSKMMSSLRLNWASQGRIVSLMQMNTDTQDILRLSEHSSKGLPCCLRTSCGPSRHPPWWMSDLKCR